MNILLLRILRRAPAVLTLPPHSTTLALNVGNLLQLGVAPSALPIAALEEVIQRPGVLATPRDLQAWTEIGVLRGSTLRTALEGFASADARMTSYVACRLLSSCSRLRAGKNVVAYLARQLRNAPPATLTASQCILAICGLAACHHPLTDPLYTTLIARINEEGTGCDLRLLVASFFCAALRPLFTPVFLAGVMQDLRAGVYKPPRAATMLLGLRFTRVVHGDIVSDVCNVIWRTHSGSMCAKDRFKLMQAGGNLEEMRRSLSDRSAEYLEVVPAKDLYHVVAERWWDVGTLQSTLEAALLPKVAHFGQKRLVTMLKRQVTLRRFNVPLTDAFAEALGPQRIPLGLACRALCLSGYIQNGAALKNPRPFLDAMLAARSVDFQQLTSGGALFHSIRTLVKMRQRGYREAPVGDALTATAAWISRTGISGKPLPLHEALSVTGLLGIDHRLTHTERRTLSETVFRPIYLRILEGLSTASVGMVAVALILAPPRDRSRIGQRLVAVTGDNADAFQGISAYNVLQLARIALFLLSPVDAAHLHRHFTHWCRTRSRLSPSQSVAALRLLTMAPRVSTIVLRKFFVNVRLVVSFLKPRDVTRALVAMARCHCVDKALFGGLMDRALAVVPLWEVNEIAPAILAMAHLRVVCHPVLEALVRRLRTFHVCTQRRHAPKVVEALAALIAKRL